MRCLYGLILIIGVVWGALDDAVASVAFGNDSPPQILTQSMNITAYVGDTVVLPCEIANLNNHHVMWIRLQEQQTPVTLTVGYQQFSRNMRYRVARVHRTVPKNSLFKPASSIEQDNEAKLSTSSAEIDNENRVNIESWNFEIRKVSPEDQGLYECFVKLNSKLKVKTNINLIVKSEKEAHHRKKSESHHHHDLLSDYSSRSERMSNSMEKMHILPNSRVKLRCNATGLVSLVKKTASSQHGHHLPQNELQWYKDGKLIEQDSRRLKKWVSSYDNSNYMELELYALGSDDSGHYQCKRDKSVLKNVYLSVAPENHASRLTLQQYHANLVLFVSFFLAILIVRN